ncbi:hypothetical protein WR25_03885 [Diploscapter pachys]|uniref:Uncharacterized protein n=1 Tax=Diploscapter pachys TaxID=2018661 RepID=A0A2A2JMV2_9BILA|nr:hypothetical protein WR25_03885 [Diploscapter pachys]
MGQSQSYDLTNGRKPGKESLDEVKQTGLKKKNDTKEQIIYAYENKPAQHETQKRPSNDNGNIEVIRYEELQHTQLHIEPHSHWYSENDPGFTREIKVDDDERNDQVKIVTSEWEEDRAEPEKVTVSSTELYVLRKVEPLETTFLNSRPSASHYD